MKNLQLFIGLLLFFGTISAKGQEAPDSLLAKDNIMIPLPTVSVNFGFNHLKGDIPLDKSGPSPFSQLAYGLTITQSVAKFLDASLVIYAGNVKGETTIGNTNINFRTNLFSQQLNIEYNFYPLFKPDDKGRQLIRPYLGFGVGLLSFRSKGDLKNENGVVYQYWSDGTIRAEAEGSVAPSESTLLERDFEYETDLRDANLDGLRKYSQLAFSLPINAGIRFQITKNFGVNAGFCYAFNFTDLIDNVSDAGSGDRKGSKGFDNHLFGSIGISVFLGRTKHSSKPKRTFQDVLADEKEVSEPSKTEESDKALNEQKESTVSLNDLASISERLIQATEAIETFASNSEEFLSEKSNELTEITTRNLESKKDLRAAKKESIAILDGSMAALRKTDAGLAEATGDLNSAYTDFTDKKVDTRPATTNKVKNTFETKIPAMEALKRQIDAAKSPAELKSVLNITTKNLTHTNEIFKNESSRINESILNSRKAVIEARVEQLKSEVETSSSNSGENGNEFDSPSNINQELEKLFNEGILSEAEYNELRSTAKDVEEQLVAIEESATSEKKETNQEKLASTTELLNSASETLTAKTEQAEKLLATYGELLDNLSKEELSSKTSLQRAKEKALEIVEKSNETLVETNSSLNSVANDLNEASTRLADNRSIPQLAGTNNLKSAVVSTIPSINESKNKINSAKTAKDLSEILANASKNLTETSETISTERTKIEQTSLKTRKYVALARLDMLANQPQTNEEELNSLTAELEFLEKEKLLSTRDLGNVSEVLARINIADNNSATDQELDSSEGNDEQASSAQTSTEIEAKSEKTNLEPNKTSTTRKTTEGQPRTVEEIENTPPKESGGFHWADVNHNGWISPDEVLHFIDMLFEGESERTVEDIQNLIDYYFDQE